MTYRSDIFQLREEYMSMAGIPTGSDATQVVKPFDYTKVQVVISALKSFVEKYQDSLERIDVNVLENMMINTKDDLELLMVIKKEIRSKEGLENPELIRDLENVLKII